MALFTASIRCAGVSKSKLIGSPMFRGRILCPLAATSWATQARSRIAYLTFSRREAARISRVWVRGMGNSVPHRLYRTGSTPEFQVLRARSLTGSSRIRDDFIQDDGG